MAQTGTNAFKLGTKAPDFRLLDTQSDKMLSLNELKSNKATVIMFLCNHCPYVKHVERELVKFSKAYIPKGVSFIAISSNDPLSYPEDGPDKMKEVAKELGYPFPYLFDETQNAAKAYLAACTPDFYLFDQNLLCIYHGRFDDSTPGRGTPTGNDLKAALEAHLSGKSLPQESHPSLGCSIKWKK